MTQIQSFRLQDTIQALYQRPAKHPGHTTDFLNFNFQNGTRTGHLKMNHEQQKLHGVPGQEQQFLMCYNLKLNSNLR